MSWYAGKYCSRGEELMMHKPCLLAGAAVLGTERMMYGRVSAFVLHET